MLPIKYYVFNSFAEQPFGGNPAGVILDASGLSDEKMQLIARQLNLVETVFAFPEPEPGIAYWLRYFTPAKELLITGHPTIAAWACLLHFGAVAADSGPFVQKTNAGNISVMLENGRVYATQKPAVVTPRPELPWRKVAETVNLNEADIDKEFPAVTVDCGLGHLIFCVRSLDALMAMRFHPEQLGALCQAAGARECQIFCMETKAPGLDGHTRNLCPRLGLEDPACGNGNAALGAYVSRFVRKDDRLHLIFEQGHIVNMPSVIEVIVKPDQIMIGGNALLMQEGVIYVWRTNRFYEQQVIRGGMNIEAVGKNLRICPDEADDPAH